MGKGDIDIGNIVFLISVILAITGALGLVLSVTYDDILSENKKQNTCNETCAQYKILSCDEKYIVCDSDDGGVLKIIENE